MLSNLESDGPTSQSRMTKGTVKSINTEKEPDNPDDEDQFADSDCDDEDDKYRLQSKPSERKKVSETKRQDAAAFQAWLFNNRDTNMSGKQQPGKANDSLDATMMGHHWSKKIIANPRQYQIELFERAKEKNTIVVLDTGKLLRSLSWHISKEIDILLRIWKNIDCRIAPETCSSSGT